MTHRNLGRALLVAASLIGSLATMALAANPLAGMTFTRWTDPREGAYSFEAPRGWRVQGGTFRPYAGSGALQQTLLTSPDGRIPFAWAT